MGQACSCMDGGHEHSHGHGHSHGGGKKHGHGHGDGECCHDPDCSHSQGVDLSYTLTYTPLR